MWTFIYIHIFKTHVHMHTHKKKHHCNDSRIFNYLLCFHDHDTFSNYICPKISLEINLVNPYLEIIYSWFLKIRHLKGSKKMTGYTLLQMAIVINAI